jgi:hypothetical protein
LFSVFLIEKAVALLLAPLGMGLLLGMLALAAASLRWRKVGFVLGSVAVAWRSGSACSDNLF